MRASEIGSLTVNCFNFNSTPARIILPAKSSKHRSEDIIPLRKSIAKKLKKHLAMKLPAASAFPKIPDHTRIAQMLKIDLKKAKIPYKDAGGRYADFYSLRHTFVSNLAKSGVHPRVAQSLARHSDINLTMQVYSHITLENQLESLDMLPDFTVDASSKKDKKTG